MDHHYDADIRKIATKLSKILQENGIHQYQLRYTGANDSTDGFDVETVPEGMASSIQHHKINTISFYNRYNNQSNQYEYVRQERSQDLDDAVYDLAVLLWERAGQGGWYNNDGGRGEVIIFQGGFVEFQHVNYEDTTEYDDDGEQVGDTDYEEHIVTHWRFNTLVGPIDAPYEETIPA